MTSLYPVIYNDAIPKFYDAFEKAQFPDYSPPSLESLSENFPKKEEKPIAPQIQTGIIQSLYETLKRADEDYQNVTKAKFTGILREDNRLETDIENFYQDRCQLYADEILQTIRGLIQLDGYDETVFGNYRNIYNCIIRSNGIAKAQYLKQLIIHALTVVPTDLRYEKVELIEPAISGNMIEKRM